MKAKALLPITHTTAAAFVVAAAGVTVVPHQAFAQNNPTLTNVIPQSESATIQAKITAIDTATRTVTLKGGSGETVSVVAGPAVRLEMLKVGDIVNAQYYRSVGFMWCPQRAVTVCLPVATR